MAKLREIVKWSMLVGLLSSITFWVIVRVLPPAPDYSPTPQETMKKLEKAIEKSDSRQIASLFSSRKAFETFMNVPVDSLTSTQSVTAIKRNSSQSSLEAWEIWFKDFGLDHLKYGKMANGVGVRCYSSGGGFGFGVKQEEQGYMIYHCGYSV